MTYSHKNCASNVTWHSLALGIVSITMPHLRLMLEQINVTHYVQKNETPEKKNHQDFSSK